MKKLTGILAYSFSALLILLTAGCSGGSAGMVDKIPDNVDAAVVGNIDDIVKSLGGSIENNKILLPSYLTSDLNGHDFEELKDILSKIKDSGVKCEHIAIAGNYKDYMPVVLFQIDDEKKFKRFVEDEGFDDGWKEDGISFFIKKENSEYSSYTREYAFAVKDGYGYFTSSSSYADVKAQRVLERFIEGAGTSPLSKTKIGEFISKSETLGGAFKIPKDAKRDLRGMGLSAETASLLDGYFCFSAKLDGDKLKGTLCLLDEDGKKIDTKTLSSYFDHEAKISSKALSYLNKKEQAVLALSLKKVKWNKLQELVQEYTYGSASMMFSVAQGYLSKIDGTVAIGLGIDGGIEVLSSMDSNPSVASKQPVTIVVETKPGKAKGIFNDITDMLDLYGIAYSKSGKGDVKISLPADMGDFYMKYDENILVISTLPVKAYGDNLVVKEFDFDDYLAAYGFVIDGKNEFMKDLDLSAFNLSGFAGLDTSDGQISFLLSVNGKNKEGFLGQVVRLAKAFEENTGNLRHSRYSSSYDYDYYDYDYYDDDSVAVEEVWPEIDDDYYY